MRTATAIALVVVAFATAHRLDMMIADSSTSSFQQTALPPGEVDTTQTLTTTTTKGTFFVTILSEKEYEARHPGTAGITYFRNNPCAIEIPSGWEIDFVPYSNQAHFRNLENADTLAHEILHCMIPDWHAGFTARLQHERR